MGSGLGVKPHDLPCYVCHRCHDDIDSRSYGLTKEDRERMWLLAHRDSVLWLLQSGLLELTKKNPATI